MWNKALKLTSVIITFVCAFAFQPNTATAFAPENTNSAMTRITIHVPECKNCKIALERWNQNGEGWPNQKIYKLKNGWVHFSIPRAETRGITFHPRTADWRGMYNSASVVAVQYSGIRPGRKISIAQAKRMKTGSPCWAGTIKSRYLITIKTYRWNGKPDEYSSGKNVSFWASPQLDSVPTVYEVDGVMPVLFGGLGTQQILECQS